ncbi:MAG: glycosyltransferase [Lachnospiraceae bacterium]|nr:glycosyltransferase [Lachnospiraceae bacterium]
MRNEKIVVVGPVYPFKGGISHYTGLLTGALRKSFADVRMVSYSMQYPRLLFKKEQRDYANDAFKVENVEFILNTANPFNIGAVGKSIASKKPDLVIIEWWHPYFAPCYILLCSSIKKRCSAKLLFTCHNVFPHERFPLDRFLTRLTLRFGDYFIVHSKVQAKELESIKKNPEFKINMHPTYEAFKFNEGGEKDFQSSSLPGQAEKSKETFTLLFFGFVRPYKGLHVLIKALAALPESFELIIAGDFGGSREEYEAEILEKGLNRRIEIHDGYMPDSDVQTYFERADAVVLPYTDATQSGILQIAFGFGKPVIATKVGGLPEAVVDGVTGVLCEPSDSESLANGIMRLKELMKSGVDFKANIAADSERFSWGHMVSAIEELAFGNSAAT